MKKNGSVLDQIQPSGEGVSIDNNGCALQQPYRMHVTLILTSVMMMVRVESRTNSTVGVYGVGRTTRDRLV